MQRAANKKQVSAINYYCSWQTDLFPSERNRLTDITEIPPPKYNVRGMKTVALTGFIALPRKQSDRIVAE